MPYIKGTNGQDTLLGTVGADQIFGFNGNDTIDGKEGQNEIHGGGGNDVITTGKGRDLIYGDDGDDGDDGNDLINVIGNYSGTYIVGDNDDDTVSLDRANEGTFLSLDYEHGKYGSNTLDDVIIRDDRMDIKKSFSSTSSRDRRCRVEKSWGRRNHHVVWYGGGR